MASYTVHLPPGGADRFEKARFLRDGFSWVGFSYGPFWLVSQGAWIAGLIMLGLHLGLALLVMFCDLPALVGALGFSLLQLLIGLEGASMIRWQLDLKGWHEAGVVTGNDIDALEQRFFADAMTAETTEFKAPDAVPAGMRASVPVVLGLFPQHPGGSR